MLASGAMSDAYPWGHPTPIHACHLIVLIILEFLAPVQSAVETCNIRVHLDPTHVVSIQSQVQEVDRLTCLFRNSEPANVSIS